MQYHKIMSCMSSSPAVSRIYVCAYYSFLTHYISLLYLFYVWLIRPFKLYNIKSRFRIWIEIEIVCVFRSSASATDWTTESYLRSSSRNDRQEDRILMDWTRLRARSSKPSWKRRIFKSTSWYMRLKGKCQEEQGWRCGPSAQARHGHHAIRQNHILLQMNLNFRGNWFSGDLQHDLSDAMMEECGPMYPHTSGRVELAAPALQGQ